MRIGIDGSCWVNPRGYGRFTREIIGALAQRAAGEDLIIFIDEWSARSLEFDGPNVTLRPVPTRASQAGAASSSGNRTPADMLRMGRAVKSERLDVFFSPSVYTYFPLPRGLPAVVTIHDAIAERFPKLTLPSFKARLFWRAKVWLALRQARIVLTVSRFAAEEIHEVLHVPQSKIRVATEAPPAAYRPSESQEEIAAAAARVGLPLAARWFI
jgi:alpha-1,3-rhamnosyl/mannosyltransferase